MIWTPCCTKPRAEHEAQRDIEDLGIGTMLMIYRSVTYSRGRQRLQYRPLFPGYIFVALPDDGVGMGAVADVESISKVLSFDGRPRRIQGTEAERFDALSLSCLLGDFNHTEHRASDGKFSRKQRKRRRRPRRGKRLGKNPNMHSSENQVAA